jgi:hypothetical protein
VLTHPSLTPSYPGCRPSFSGLEQPAGVASGARTPVVGIPSPHRSQEQGGYCGSSMQNSLSTKTNNKRNTNLSASSLGDRERLLLVPPEISFAGLSVGGRTGGADSRWPLTRPEFSSP